MSTNSIRLQALQFSVAGLLKGPMGKTRTYELRLPISQVDQLDESFDVTGPLSGAVRFLRTGETVFTEVDASVQVHLECSRCLQAFDTEIDFEIKEEFHPSVDIGTGRVVTDLGDDDALIIDEQHVLDLSEVVRQAIILALPITPTCQDDCKGLCPTCGTNRNTKTCDCVDEVIDPRWDALSMLLELQDDES
ncbi:MAG: DUF177 domain-containing protein [Chloroflexi bacterium]|nr:DUF177 domain-containing protein [Chloroflexota bacterium]